MRTARLVGLSPDGKSLIVATESGEEFMIEADERLRAALRGDLPRLGQLEIEMQTSLTPATFRRGSGQARPSRMWPEWQAFPMDRVERFAVPVLAEREHVASMDGVLGTPPRRALGSPEPSYHGR